MTETNEATRARIARKEEERLNQYPTRKLALARSIGERFLGTPKLKPAEAPGLLGSGIIDIQNVYDDKVSTIAWTLLANRLAASVADRIIDHPWTIVFDGPPYEPWGFVTEPYLDDSQELRESFERFVRLGHHWLQIEVLTKEESPWNPGACLPIAVLIREGQEELRGFVRWALANIRNEL
jgi:hypothetical protein